VIDCHQKMVLQFAAAVCSIACKIHFISLAPNLLLNSILEFGNFHLHFHFMLRKTKEEGTE
jgi:hypothetical protein